ncbi:aldo/keto reductase [Pedobacter alpinus]|uniref:Aldo/keto reductase n=1 Tax=Pedobacter alpinus TaxID=1590643 RepID=A0ABW5TPV6_9SPHI
MSKISAPKIILGTSNLGNLYQALPYQQKLDIVETAIKKNPNLPVFDTAGKYGAGLALESLGKCLKDLDVKQDQVIISNKLGWLRMPLITDEPTFEQGVWKDLEYDAYQDISYDGILKCYEQGNELLNGLVSQWVSVHDPDEYLVGAKDTTDRKSRFNDILEAYRALKELKQQGKVKAIGIGAKNWEIIKEISTKVDFDWVMFANSLTLYSHPKELADFIKILDAKGVLIINSAVFNGGFLTGGDFFNYQLLAKDDKAYHWREKFYELCKQFEIKPAEACVYFGLNVPGVSSIALSSSSPERTAKNLQMDQVEIPISFWETLKKEGLLEADYQIK